MSDTVLTTLIAAGIPAIVTIVTAVCQLRSKRITNQLDNQMSQINGKFEAVDIRLDDLKKDDIRIQLLYLMNHTPEDKESVLKVAEKYFNELDGNWYMTDLFTKWAKKQKVDISKIKIIHQERK